jgi:hypothetical protein
LYDGLEEAVISEEARRRLALLGLYDGLEEAVVSLGLYDGSEKALMLRLSLAKWPSKHFLRNGRRHTAKSEGRNKIMASEDCETILVLE